MTRYGRSPWLERAPRSRTPSYPRLDDAVTTDVVVVGGGLTGCATAYAFAAAGVKVVLLEAERLGTASTAGGVGWLSEAPEVSFHSLEQSLGLRAARRAWQAWRRAALDCAALVRRLDVKCQLVPQQTVQVARTPAQVADARREARARRHAGLEAVLANAATARSESGVEAAAAVRTRDGATLDPYRATLGLASAAAVRGAQLFERSVVRSIRTTPKTVEVATAGGTVTAYRVIVATGQPTELFRSLARHVKRTNTYCALTEPLPARVRRALAKVATVTVDMAEPRHCIRWVDDNRLLVSGADGPPVSERAREKTVIQRTGQLMYELSTLYPDISGLLPTHGWHAEYGATADGLPFVGPHRNYPRHLFAFGGGGHSATAAYLASRILLRHYLGETDAVDEVFGFTRTSGT